MSDNSEKLIQELYNRGYDAWRSYQGTLGHLLVHLEQADHFLQAFGHLMPDQQPSQPLDPVDVQRAIDEARDGPPPPPLPDEPHPPVASNGVLDPDRDEALRQWEQTFNKRHPIRGVE